MDSNPSYDAWDEDAVRHLSDRHDERAFQTHITSSFTAINRSQTQPFTLQSSATLSFRETQTQSTTDRRRRRNLTVARYLGLESFEAPTQLTVPDDRSRSPPRKSQRKRRKVEDSVEASLPRSTPVTHQSAPVQPRVSESLRVTKPRHKPISSSRKRASECSALNKDVHTKDANRQSEQQWHEKSRTTAHNIATEPGATGEEALSTGYNEHEAIARSYNLNIDDCDTDSYGPSHGQQLGRGGALIDEDEFDDDLDDEVFLKLASDMIDTEANIGSVSEPLSDPIPSHKVHDDQRPNSSTDASYAFYETDSAMQRSAKKFVSPVTMTTRLLAATSDVDRAEAKKPIVRPPFPTAVRDRSPIIGLSSNPVLKTCFRIGEAINQAHHSYKSGKHVIFELYTRIFDSHRDETKQYFTLCDLFHGKPPYIKAIYEGAIWKSVQLFDYDSKRLLQQGRICRCIGTMKREEKQWTITVVNIWESTWEDIKWVEGIVDS